MSKSMSKYRATETVRARKVTDPETVVTDSGVNTAQSGDYIVEHQNGDGSTTVYVLDADTFEKEYEPVSAPKPVKKTAPKPATPKKRALPAAKKA